jgi:SNF2 family DNA or RNA helicase
MTENSTGLLKEGAIIEGPYWPEKVQLKAWKKRGTRIELQVVGIDSKKFYEQIIPEEELMQRIKLLTTEAERNFGSDPENFRIALEAQRIRLAYEYDPHFAVSISQVDTLPHQLTAVYHYLLKQPRIRFLLADDAGAGKTIMAALLLKELKYRDLAKRILIIVPPNLISQWADEKEGELAKKFSEHFTIVNSATMRATAGRNVWEEYDQCIASIDFAKQEEVRKSLQEVPWDLVIVDEAHKLAAYMSGNKTTKTDRYLLGEILCRNSEHVLFLTATPHRGNPENFRLLLSLLDPDLYANEEILKQAIRNNENKIFLRRLKEDMIDWEGKRLFPPRHAHTMSYQLSEQELNLYNAVTAYIQRSFMRLKPNQHGMIFGLLVLQRRLASSVRAIRKSLERKIKRFEDYIRAGQLAVSQIEYAEPDEDAEDEERIRVEDAAALSVSFPISFLFSSSNQSGCVKSPVARRLISFSFASRPILSRFMFGLVARAYLSADACLLWFTY